METGEIKLKRFKKKCEPRSLVLYSTLLLSVNWQVRLWPRTVCYDGMTQLSRVIAWLIVISHLCTQPPCAQTSSFSICSRARGASRFKTIADMLPFRPRGSHAACFLPCLNREVQQWYVSTLPEQWFCCQDKLLWKYKLKHHTDIQRVIQLLVGINIFILFNQSMKRVRKIELLRSTPEISSTHFTFPWRCIFSIVLPLPDALTCKNRSLKLRQNIRMINSTFYLDLHIHSPLRLTPT